MSARDMSAGANAESAIPDVLAPGLEAVFCGINPGRVSAAAGAHFANARNDFWRLLHDAGFTPELLGPDTQFDLLEHGYGVTNAAFRTTPGSGDLRRGDFAGSAERLERLARELGPRAIGFVGKEAYRGAFRERAELGLQQRWLAATWLFVLPSTSPANAAVPYGERRRWFRAFRHALDLRGPEERQAARALVVDTGERVLLVAFRNPETGDVWWATPGGGIEGDESDADALRRELVEEIGLEEPALGPCIWVREHTFPWDRRLIRQFERFYLLSTEPFVVRPRLTAAQLLSEGVTEVRWWRLDEIERSDERFAPRRLAPLVRGLLRDGPPPEPIDVGV